MSGSLDIQKSESDAKFLDAQAQDSATTGKKTASFQRTSFVYLLEQ